MTLHVVLTRPGAGGRFSAVTSTPFVRDRPTASIYEIEESANMDEEEEIINLDEEEMDEDEDEEDASPVKTRRSTKGKAPAKAPAKEKATAKPKASAKGNKGKAKATAAVSLMSDSEEEIPLTRLTMNLLILTVFVDDGVGSHSLAISTLDNLEVLHTKIASKMGQPVHCVHLGVEAPWGSKAGQKKRPIYIISELDLDHFWVTGLRHIDSKTAGGKKSRVQAIDELGASILFVNMLEAAQVSRASFQFHNIADALSPQRSQLAAQTLKRRSTRRPKPWASTQRRQRKRSRPKPARRSPPLCSARTTTVSATTRSVVDAPSTRLQCSRSTPCYL